MIKSVDVPIAAVHFDELQLNVRPSLHEQVLSKNMNLLLLLGVVAVFDGL